MVVTALNATPAWPGLAERWNCARFNDRPQNRAGLMAHDLLAEVAERLGWCARGGGVGNGCDDGGSGAGEGHANAGLGL